MPGSLKMRHSIMTIVVLFVVCTSFAMLERVGKTPFSPIREIASELKIERSMGKHLAPVSVQISPPAHIPEYEHQEMMLTGYITLNSTNENDVNFEWVLPPGVNLVSGDLKGSWSQMKPGETATAVIYITGFSKEFLRHIILQSEMTVGDELRGGSSLISSRPEDSLEYVASDMREYMEKSRPSEFKRGRLIK